MARNACFQFSGINVMTEMLYHKDNRTNIIKKPIFFSSSLSSQPGDLDKSPAQRHT